MEVDFLSEAYWNNRYIDGQTSWDIGYVSTPLKDYFDQLKNKDLRILIPGCGNSYEAAYLLALGCKNLTLIDLSKQLTESLQKILQNNLPYQATIITGDFFELSGTFDLIIEQTFFCALDPELREKYVAKMASLLSGNGKLVGLLFNKQFPNNPPFGGNKNMYKQLFNSHFRIKVLEDCYNSIQERAGSEFFMIAEKRV